jgi:hypothetical protein
MTRVMIIAGILAAAALGTAQAQQAQEERTIRGEVVAVACYTDPQIAVNSSPDAKASCSLSALKAGEPAGVVDQQTGKLYIVLSADGTNVSDKLLPNVAKLVDVKGTVQEKAGVNTITVSEVRPVENAPTQAGTMPPENATQGNMSGMSSGTLGEEGSESLFNTTEAPGVHNATSEDLTGIPNRGTRIGDVYTGEKEGK